MKKGTTVFKLIMMLFLFIIVFLYAVTFNNEAGWSLLVLSGLFLAVTFLSLVSSLKKITIDNVQSMVTKIGEKKKVRLELQNATASFFPVLVVKSSELEINQIFPLFFKKKKSIESEWIPQKRGHIKELTIELQSSDFFGLLVKNKVKKIPSDIYVLPKDIKPIDDIVNLFESKVEQLLFGESSFELEKIRPYVSGDPLKGIDWKLSSKKDQLIYREYENHEKKGVLFLFYGAKSSHFEAILSVYFNFFQHNREPRYRFVLHGEGVGDGENIELLDFCKIKNGEKLEKIPFFKETTVLIFTPEQTKNLEMIIEDLSVNKWIQVIDYQSIIGGKSHEF